MLLVKKKIGKYSKMLVVVRIVSNTYIHCLCKNSAFSVKFHGVYRKK